MALEEIAPPELSAGQVLVRVRAVGVCGSDIHGFAGKTRRRTPGMVMGHEIAGEIAEAGPGVKDLRKGMPVAVQPILFCGSCPLCREGKTSVCLNKRMIGVNMGRVGGLSEYIAAPASNVFPVRADVSPASACLAEPLAVGESAVQAAQVREGETVLIVGAGMIGQAILLALGDRKPGRILVVDNNARRLATAQELGAVGVDFSQEDAVRRVLAETAGSGVDVAIEAVGLPASVVTAQQATRVGGRILWIGNSHKMVEVDMEDVVVRAKSIQGVYCYSNETFARACRFIEANPKTVSRFVEKEVRLDEAGALFAQLAHNELDVFRAVVLI
jgi:L-iditol 2-dehydrogenase